MSAHPQVTGWIGRALHRRDQRVCDSFGDQPVPILLHAPPGFYLALLRDHLVGERGATERHVGEEQRGAGVTWILEVETVDGGHHQVVAARCPLSSPAHGLTLGPGELAIIESDLPDFAPPDASALVRSTQGWPEYLLLVDRSNIRRTGDIEPTAERFVLTGAHAEVLAERCMGHMGERARETYGTLAVLDRFTESMVESLQPGLTVHAARAGGLPIVDEADGWLRLLEPVRTMLRCGATTISHAAAMDLRTVLVAAADPFGAAFALARVGRADVAGGILRELPTHVVDDADQSRVIPLLRLLIDESKDDGRLTLMLARAHLNRSEFAEQRACLEHARLLAREQLADGVAIEAEAELLAAELDSLTAAENRARLAAIRVERDGRLSRPARIRLREVEALIDANSGRLADIHSAANQLEVVANEWELIGDRGRASMTLRTMSASCLLYLGDYRAGIAAMERACTMVHDRPKALLRSMRLLVHLLALAGETEAFDAAADEETRLSRSTHGPPWLAAYRSWSMMIRGSMAGNADRVAQAHTEARVRLGELLEHETGALFIADSAVSFALVGDADAAYEALAEARRRPVLDPVDLLLAEVTVEARHGDPAAVHELATRRRRQLEIPSARAWRIDLECTIAMRAHPADGAAVGVDVVVADAERFGLETLAKRLLALAGLDATRPVVTVQLLGSLQVSIDGTPVVAPTGKVAELLKLLAVRDHTLPIDVVVEHLWPDTEFERGRSRLRNCLNRLRNRLGEGTVVRSGDTLALGPTVRTDLREFWVAVSQIGSDPDAAERALACFTGDLLESDLYDDWLMGERQAVRSAVRKILRSGRADGTISAESAVDVEHRLARES